MTLNDLCTSAVGIVNTDAATPSAADLATALECLIGCADSFSADPAKIYTSIITTKTLVIGQQVYTIGADASRDINLARPQAIKQANLIDLSNPAYPVRNPMNILDDAGWARIRLQKVSVPIPLDLYYDGGDARIGATTVGFGSIYLHGIPSAANQLEIYTEQLLSVYSSLTDLVIVPPGYYEAYLYGTCKRLYIRFARPADPAVLALESDALAKLEGRNLDTPILQLDSGLPHGRPPYFDARSNRQL